MKSISILATILALGPSAGMAAAATKAVAPGLSARIGKTAPARYEVQAIPFQQFALSNGLTLIVNEDHTRPVVAVTIWYHVGSQNEAAGRTGFAHLFEHLMFNGSKHADDDWFKLVNPIGAVNLNGTTSNDRTNFFQTVPVGALERLLWLESDRMGHLLGAVNQAKLDEQRGVVQNEKRQRANSPFGAIPETISAAIYPPGHPYSWETIGSMEDLNAASLEDVKNWFNTWYGAGNTVISISGDVHAAATRALVQKYFGFIPRGPALTRNEKWVAKRSGERRAAIQVPAPQGDVIQVWNVPGYGSREAALLNMAAHVLGGGRNSRLYRRLVDKDAIATSVSASNIALELGGQFQITGSPKPGVDPLLVERTIREELARFLGDGPTVDELERFKFATYANSIRLSEQIEGKAISLAEDFLYTGDAASHRRTLEQQYAADPDAVQRVAKDWLSDGVYVLNATPLRPATVAADVDRTQMPPVTAPKGLALVAPREFSLSNGLKVALVERNSAPTVAMQLIFRSGTSADRGRLPPDAGDMATALTLKGTRTRSETDILEESQRLGVGMGWANSDESLRYSFNGLKATLDGGLELYSDTLINPSFPERLFERDRALMSAELEQRESTPGGKIGRVFSPLLLGPDHPYANVATPASLAALKLKDLRDWYSRWIRPDNATLLVVGNVGEAELRPLLERHFSAWRAPATPLPQVPPLPAPALRSAPEIFLIDQPGAQQSTIAIAGLAPTRTDPGYEAMELAANVLGGGFLGRLNLNLREAKHWSYGAYASYRAQRTLGRFDISTSVQTDKTAEALAEINREVREILNGRKPSSDELRKVKDERILTLTANLGSASGLADYYAQNIRFGLDHDYWNARAARAEAMTGAEIEAAAARLIKPDQLFWVVVGDVSKIEADVRKSGIGSVSVIGLDRKVHGPPPPHRP